MEIIPINNYVNTTVWWHDLDFNETLEGKARWELHEDPACHFEQIPGAAFFKTAAVWPLISHLTDTAGEVRLSP